MCEVVESTRTVIELCVQDDSEETTPPVSQSNGTYGRLPPEEVTADEEDNKTEATQPLRQEEEEGDTSLATPTPAVSGGVGVQPKVAITHISLIIVAKQTQ